MKLIAFDAAGNTVYAVLLDADGQAWNGSSFETLAGANWATYDIALTEGGGGIYVGTLPTLAAGSYIFQAYRQAGGSPATSDTQISRREFVWNGTNEASLASVVADAIPADGSRPTIEQGIYMLVQNAFEKSVSGATVTINKVDGSTALLTLTLNDANSPTSITRAT